MNVATLPWCVAMKVDILIVGHQLYECIVMIRLYCLRGSLRMKKVNRVHNFLLPVHVSGYGLVTCKVIWVIITIRPTIGKLLDSGHIIYPHIP